MLNRVLGTLSRYSMCSPGHHVAVAVSGGADSVCLLHVLLELAPALQIQLSIAHLNHKLRGQDSDSDADFVRALAEKLKLPYHYEEADVASVPGNLEQAGRNARLDFFGRLPADRIATGHTRSDQAETVLYRLLRGSGTAGLSGVLPVVDRRIRPLIECSREEVESFLTERGIEWREDATNAGSQFARNRLRHSVIPRLRAEYPGIEEILARTAMLAQDEELYWNNEIDRLASGLFQRMPKVILVNAEEISRLPTAVQRRLLRRAILEVKGDLRQIDLCHIDALLSLVGQQPGHGRFQAPGIDVFRSFEWLRIATPRTESRWDRDYAIPLQAPGRTPIPGQFTAVCVEVAENAKYPMQVEGYNTSGGTLDADRLSGPLELRNWHPGDQFTRPGHSSEKIKALFQLARIPIWDRQGWPVITSGDRIVWTRRFGGSSEYLSTRESRRILHIVEEKTDR